MIKEADPAYGINGAILSLQWAVGSKKSALLAHTKAVMQPVKTFDNTLFQQVPNYYINEDNFWLFAEFQTAYDPCPCIYDDKDYRLTFKLEFVQQADINLKATGTVTEQIANSSTPGGMQAQDNVPMLGPENLQNAINVGTKAYKEWEGYGKQITSAFDQADPRVGGYLWKKVLADSPSGIWVTGYSNKPGKGRIKDQTGLKDAGSAGVKAVQGLQDWEKFKKVGSVVASAVPYVGTALALVDFFVNGGEQQQATSASRAPTTFGVDLDITGTLKKTTFSSQKNMHLPGSKPATSYGIAGNIPNYNNLLGVVNLAELPKLEYMQYG